MMEKAISLLFLLFSILYFFMARQLSFGTISAPKAGFLPVLAGSTAVVIAAALVLGQMRQKQAASTDVLNWRKVIFILIGLVLYVLLLPLAGYLAATFIIMLYLLKVTDTAGWLYPCIIAACVAGGFCFLFENLLGINLP